MQPTRAPGHLTYTRVKQLKNRNYRRKKSFLSG